MSRRTLTLVVAAVAVAVLVAVGQVLPVPYVLFQPGPVANTLGPVPGGSRPLVRITGTRTYPTSGKLDLTTIRVGGGPGQQPTLFEALAGWFDGRTAVLPEQLVFPPDVTQREVSAENAAQMQQSQDAAVVAALRYLGYRVPTQVTVESVRSGAPAEGVLRKGDVITAVDGTRIGTTARLQQLISARRPGTPVRLTIRRSGTTRTVRVPTTAAKRGSDRAIVGITVSARPDPPFRIDIGLRDVGGPSAGMMFALAITDKLTPGALTGGRFVAGTGTIDDSGAVGPIGGVQQKIYAAAAAGASVFLVPSGDCPGAQEAAPASLRLVRVDTLRQAVGALRALDKGQPVRSC